MDEWKHEMVIQIMAGVSKSQLVKRYGYSRQHITNIVKELSGGTQPSLMRDFKVNWKGLSRLRELFGIDYPEICKAAKINPNTARHIFMGDERYIYNPSAYKVLIYMLQTLLARNDELSNLEKYIKPVNVHKGDAVEGQEQDKAQASQSQ